MDNWQSVKEEEIFLKIMLGYELNISKPSSKWFDGYSRAQEVVFRPTLISYNYVLFKKLLHTSTRCMGSGCMGIINFLFFVSDPE
jgi:hypothetical protein